MTLMHIDKRRDAKTAENRRDVLLRAPLRSQRLCVRQRNMFFIRVRPCPSEVK